jgi:hypothetical protein
LSISRGSVTNIPRIIARFPRDESLRQIRSLGTFLSARYSLPLAPIVGEVNVSLPLSPDPRTSESERVSNASAD